MRISWVSLLALAAAAPAGALELVHEPVACTVPGRYARVVARGVPAEGVAAAEVRFRADADHAWYVARMVQADGAWATALPRPQGLARFEYEVVLTGTDAAVATTGPVAIDVRADCAVPGAAVAEAISVQVPPGAPLVPPVPAGFSPVGVIGPEVAKKSRKGLKIAGGAAVAAIGAGVAAAVGSTPEGAGPAVPEALTFTFDGAVPQPGTTLTAGSTLTVFLRVSPQPRRPLSYQWNAQLVSPGGAVCGSLFGRLQGVQGETLLPLSGPLVTSAACGTTFDVASVRVFVAYAAAGIESTQLDLPIAYRYQN